jgi:hypothetical protein
LIKSGYSQETVNGETVTTWHYRLDADSGKEVMLTDEDGDYTVTNAAIQDGVLYMRGTTKNYMPYETLPEFSLQNVKTGEFLWGNVGGGFDTDDADKAVWFNSFEGINSVEELKDYILLIDFGWVERTLVQGQWSFEIPVSFEILAVTYDIGRKFNMGGFELTAKDITVSPYYISINAAADGENLAKMNHKQAPVSDGTGPFGVSADTNALIIELTDWGKFMMTGPEAKIVMKDGGVIAVRVGSQWGGADGMFSIMPDVVMDPAQIERVEFGDLSFEL